MKTGIELISDERQRQIDVEGYSQQHDSQHPLSDFIYAAIAYAESAKIDANNESLSDSERIVLKNEMGRFFPWGNGFKPSTCLRDLVKAGALIAAAIDRLQGTSPKVSDNWKPGEEQMKALESCFCEFGEGCPDENGLRSLYNDLKKLI